MFFLTIRCCYCHHSPSSSFNVVEITFLIFFIQINSKKQLFLRNNNTAKRITIYTNFRSFNLGKHLFYEAYFSTLNPYILQIYLKTQLRFYIDFFYELQLLILKLCFMLQFKITYLHTDLFI